MLLLCEPGAGRASVLGACSLWVWPRQDRRPGVALIIRPQHCVLGGSEPALVCDGEGARLAVDGPPFVPQGATIQRYVDLALRPDARDFAGRSRVEVRKFGGFYLRDPPRIGFDEDQLSFGADVPVTATLMSGACRTSSNVL